MLSHVYVVCAITSFSLSLSLNRTFSIFYQNNFDFTGKKGTSSSIYKS